MPAAVLFVGLPEVRPADASAPGPGQPAVARESGGPALVDPWPVVAALPPGDHVLLVWGPGVQGGTRAVGLCRSLALRSDVAVIELPGLPTQVAAARAVLDALPADLSPATVAAVAPHALAAGRTVSVVDSVSGLHDPAPSVLQHALSVLPWTRFTVDAELGTVTGGGAAPRRAHGRLGPAWSATSGPAGDALLAPLTDWVGAATSVVHAPPGAGLPARHWAQVTVLADRPSRLAARALEGMDVRDCPACRRQVASLLCPFCGHASAAEDAAAPAPEAPVPGPLDPTPAEDRS